MRITKEQAAEHRSRIVEAAARLFRECGPAGAGVAEVTRAAGLTHGAFYNHFASKDALLADAIGAAFREHTGRLAEAVTRDGDLSGYAPGYLSASHLANRGGGCPMAALGADVARQPLPVREAFATGLREYLDTATGDANARGAALATVAGLVGAMVMARAVVGADNALAAELLAAARDHLPLAGASVGSGEPDGTPAS